MWLFAAISGSTASVAVTGVTITGEGGLSSPQNRNSGTTFQLTAEVNPTNANQSVIWRVSSGNAATVNSSGLVNCSNIGSVTIRATSTSDNSKYGEYVINVIGSGTVTGIKGTYKTWCFTGTPGNICWMTENSKEGTSSATTYPNQTAGARGYYYTWARAAAACPSGWTLPAQAEWEALKAYLNSSPDATFKTAWYASALAGHYVTDGSSWYLWGSFGGWWSSTSSGQNYRANNSSTMNGPGTDPTYYLSVRCVKSN
jgi:uncharacterized protein (TIGR02145 family)